MTSELEQKVNKKNVRIIFMKYTYVGPFLAVGLIAAIGMIYFGIVSEGDERTKFLSQAPLCLLHPYCWVQLAPSMCGSKHAEIGFDQRSSRLIRRRQPDEPDLADGGQRDAGHDG
jgi:hypothetical protein